MRNFFSLLILFPALIQSICAQQTRMPDVAGAYRKTAHTVSGIPTAEKTNTIQMMDAVVEILKKTYPQPIGADIGPYSGIFKNYTGISEFKNGPYRIYVTIPFYDFYKNYSGITEASGEYSSSIEIWINNVNYVLQGNPVKYGNDRIYREPKPGIAVNGIPKYNNMVLIIPSGKSLPWRPATKEEYLENYIEGLKASLPGRSSTTAERQLIPDAERLLASMSPVVKKQVAYLKKVEYSNTRNGYPDFGYQWAGFLNAVDTTAEKLVIIDENFYDKTLPRSSFQVIVVERRSRPASISAARPTPEQIKKYNERNDRMNAIVRNKEFLSGLQNLLGENGLAIARKQKKKSDEKYVPKNINTAYIDRIVDSMFRNYKVHLPSGPVFASPAKENNSPSTDFSSSNEKKILLALRKLETREELINYLDELDKNISAVTGQLSVTVYDKAETNTRASFGYWLIDKPKEALVLAIKAAKQKPDYNSVLNNLGSLLSICGIDYFAVPLFNVCIKKEHGNSTINNNLGQSWLALGDLEKAEYYLKQAVAANPYHHHANNSLGLIYQKRGNKNEAIKCYENSLRGSFTLSGIQGLLRLDREKALRLAVYIRHRYKQPDYINFNRYPAPLQCTSGEQTEKRKAEHETYQKTLDEQIKKYEKLYDLQKILAVNSLKDLFLDQKKQRPKLKPFQPFAIAMLSSLTYEWSDKIIRLEKEVREIDKKKVHLELEYDTALKAMYKFFEPRVEATGEGNADPTLEEEMCEATNKIVNYYLPLFAELNEERFTKIIHAFKDYLNDYLYWVRFASWTKEQYQENYYHIVLAMLRVLKEVRLTTLDAYCREKEDTWVIKPNLEHKEPHCPLPAGVEIPFVAGKVVLDCEGWGLDAGEILKLTIEHRIGGETTIAFGAGLSFYETPKIFGKSKTDVHPGIDAYAKGQFFITFEGNTIHDGGFLWAAEIDMKGIGKPVEAKQDFVFAINKGFYAHGILTHQIDKLLDIPPDKQINKNIKIYKPQ